MTHGPWPDAVAFEPEGGAGRIWQETLATPGRRVRSLLLISGEAARYSGWSARAAIALADALADRHPVILADLHFEQPELDGLIGVRDAEGVADAILFGASLDHVVLSSKDHRFELVPAGGPVPDPEAIYRHDAWARIREEAERRAATLVLYAPWRARGIEGLVPWIDMAVMLGGNTDTRLAAGYLPHDLPVRAVLSPGTPRSGTTPPTAATVAQKQAADAPVTGTAPGSRRRWVVLLLLALAAVAIGAWAFLLRGPDADTVATPAASPAPTAAAAAPSASGDPAGIALPFAITIEAHPDLADAQQRVAALRSAAPTAGFFVAPLLWDSVLYHRVMAGPVADSVEAVVLMDSLIAAGHKTGGSPWDVRNAPLAFDLGAFDTAEAADARIAELAALQIPAYALEVPYSGGGSRFHVYSGAFAGPAEADVMRQVLEAAAIPANLVQRIGRSTT